MTLNMLVIRRQLLRRLGGVNEKYSGGYNDLLLLMGVRRMGYRVVLVGGTHVAHLGQMTIVNGSNYSRELDKVRFASEHGDYVADHGLWQVKHWKWPLATTHGAAMLWRLAQTSPSTRVRQMLQRVVLILEPELTAFPASRGTHPGARREAISTSN